MEEKKIEIIFNLKSIKHNISNHIVGDTYEERNAVLKQPFEQIQQQLQLKDKMIELMCNVLANTRVITNPNNYDCPPHPYGEYEYYKQQALAELRGE